jgi:transcriptional regulator with XRE-family HTH domain
MDEEIELDGYDVEGWTQDEIAHYLMGPFDGGIPGLVRRIRRILDVSQRGLAAILGVSQSVVARWETRRTSPRTDVLLRMLKLARLRVGFHDVDTGEAVEPMRDDGDRDRADRRYPAHVDLTVTDWWHPRGLQSTTEVPLWRARSRRTETPKVTFHTSLRHVHRLLRGTPVDHPARHQHVAEAHHLDEVREARRSAMLAANPLYTPPIPPPWLSA